MKIFDKPAQLNGAELKVELSKVGIDVTEIFDFADGTIGFETDDQTKAAKVVKDHKGNTEAKEPTVADKLASVGLNLDDLRAALGI